MFIDFSKAFDTVSRDLLWKKLQMCGVNIELIKAIQSLYRGHCAKIFINGEFSQSNEIKRGVKQGCTLSPILFSTFINEFPKLINNMGLGVKLSSDVILSILLFADDIVLMCESEKELQNYS